MDWTAIGVAVSVIVMLGSLILYLHSSSMDRLEKLDKKIDDMRDRLSRFEGAFQERGYWESRRTGTDDKKK